jgi:hypothetical protein
VIRQSKSDSKFLKSVGIKPEPVEPSPDGIVRLLEENDLEVTRANYLKIAYLGNPPKELDAEIEAELPEEELLP